MIASPSDLLPLPEQEGRRRCRVGGRVVASDGQHIIVADAIGALPVQLRLNAVVQPGELVVVEGTHGPSGLTNATIVEQQLAPQTRPEGEYARLGWGGVGPHLVERSRALATVRSYFAGEQFLEVDTPLRVRTPGLDAHVNALSAHDGWLVTSPEFHMKRLLVGGLPRIYQICHCSRVDEQGRWHEPEFLMLEWYRAFAGVEAILRDTEAVVSAVVRALTGATEIEAPSGGRLDVAPPFERLTVREAYQNYAAVADAVELAERDVGEYFRQLVEQVEPALGKRPHPVFLTDFPLSQGALARPSPQDPTVAERFELYVGGIELSNGYGELTEPTQQRRRFVSERHRRRDAGEPVYPLDERFLGALREGMPPSAGNALGLDRLIALALGAPSIAAVIPFPADRV